MTEDWRENFRDSKRDSIAKPRIEAHPEKVGVRLVDPIEKYEFTLMTPCSVNPVECDTEGFYFPVDTAAWLSVSEITTPFEVDIWIRNDQGDLVAHSEGGEKVSLPDGRYHIEISSAHMKVYLLIEGDLNVSLTNTQVTISTVTADSLSVGVRSLHEQPAATITTTETPEDLMRAVSTFGSALKTTTCERSYPSLRGHPPLLEFGDSVAIPDSIEPPQTDLTIRIPPTLDRLFPIASLAYYLGASVEPGKRPELIAGDSSFSLAGQGGFEETVARLLRQIFLLDCVTRTEGYYNIELQERAIVEDQINFDLSELYQMPIAEQIQAYLSIPYEAVADAVPEWRLTADILPEPQHAETLPFLASELSIVRCLSSDDISAASPDVAAQPVQKFFDTVDTYGLEAFSRGNGDSPPVFQPPTRDSALHIFVGQGIPLGAGKMTPDNFYRRLNSNHSDKVSIEIVVVCNDQMMDAESTVWKIYRESDWIASDISVMNNLSKAELRTLFGRQLDFIHYIGHVNENGIQCSDGYLDADSISSVNVSSFLLNSCNSYDQGRKLVSRGSRGGVTTLSKISNNVGLEFGKTFAGLLSKGIPLGRCVDIIDRIGEFSDAFVVIGDPTTQVIDSPSGNTEIYRLTESDTDQYSVEYESNFTDTYTLGSFVSLFASEGSEKILCGNDTTFELDKDHAAELLDDPASVVVADDEIMGLDFHADF